MKVRVTNYIFNPTAKTITFPSYTSITLDMVLLITDVSTNIVIYNFANPILGGVANGNVLTLDLDTSTFNANNVLQIFFDDSNTSAQNETVLLLRRVVKLLESQGTVDASNRQRIAIDAVTVGVPIVSSSFNAAVTSNGWQIVNGGSGFAPYTVTNCSPIPILEGPVGQEWRIADSSRNTFANGIRSKITP